MDEYSRSLLDQVRQVLPQWVEREVARIMVAWRGDMPREVADNARLAGERAGADIGSELMQLLELDIDEQRTNPLSVLRHAVRYPTEVLRAAGVPEVQRTEFDEHN